MNKLSKAISLQNTRVKELKEKFDFYKIPNPIYGNEEIQIFTKTPLQIQTQFVAEHFLDEDYLTNLAHLDFQAVKKSKLIILSIWIGVFAIFTFVLGMTFKYLEVTSMNLFPLFSLIIITIAFCFIILNIIQLCLICKCIKGNYQLDQKLMRLFLYKEKKQLQKEQSKPDEGLKYECNNLVKDCKKDN